MRELLDDFQNTGCGTRPDPKALAGEDRVGRTIDRHAVCVAEIWTKTVR